MTLDFEEEQLFGKAPKDSTGAMQSDWKAITEQGTRKILGADATNGTITIYTVPAGKVFYLFTATASGRNDGDASTHFSIRVDNNIIGFARLMGDNSHDSFVLAPSIPLKFIAGEVFQINGSAAQCTATGYILGYEVSE